MANNRLYIGNKETRQCYCLTKADGDNWQPVQVQDLIGLNVILSTESVWSVETDLVIFSESDTVWFSHFF